MLGGPKLQPGDAPSPDAAQLGESMVILEFLADTFPEAHLLPSDAFLRAKARLFCRAVDETYTPAFVGFVAKQAPKEDLYAAIERIQGLLPPTTGFAVGGRWSIADAAFLPLYLRTLTVLEINPARAKLAPGLAAEVLATLREAPRFARIRAYLEESMARPSAQKTWDPVSRARFLVLVLVLFLGLGAVARSEDGMLTRDLARRRWSRRRSRAAGSFCRSRTSKSSSDSSSPVQ